MKVRVDRDEPSSLNQGDFRPALSAALDATKITQSV
jgi:hypothetical protein